MPAAHRVVIDDRLLIEELLVGLDRSRRVALYTTTYWYYRACRAAVLGARGHLSGPFEQLAPVEQERAILSLLDPRDDIGLSDVRATVPMMVNVAGRHPRLNLVNLEATALALLLPGEIWLSEESAAGLLPTVLDVEGIVWTRIRIE